MGSEIKMHPWWVLWVKHTMQNTPPRYQSPSNSLELIPESNGHQNRPDSSPLAFSSNNPPVAFPKHMEDGLEKVKRQLGDMLSTGWVPSSSATTTSTVCFLISWRPWPTPVTVGLPC